MKYHYGYVFQYRKEQNSEPETERFFVDSNDPDSVNACEIAMLQFLKKKGYYSGKIIRIISF